VLILGGTCAGEFCSGRGSSALRCANVPGAAEEQEEMWHWKGRKKEVVVTGAKGLETQEF